MLQINQLKNFKELESVYILNSIEDMSDLFLELASIENDSNEEFHLQNDNLFEDETVKKSIKDIISLFNFPITIVYDPYYVDKVYRDEYYEYYSKKHFKISRNTKRFVFLNGKYSRNELLQSDNNLQSEIQNNLIGMIVLKPTKTIGRILINPQKTKIQKCYIRTANFELSFLGKIYNIEAFPFSGQDSEVMTCAEVNIWQIMEYFGNRYEYYKTLLPSELFDLVKEMSDVRVLPSDGLTVEQESFIFMRNGFSPKIYYKRIEIEENNDLTIREQYENPSFEEIMHFYIEACIPVLVNLREKNNPSGENHSITCIGHSYKNSLDIIDKTHSLEYNGLDLINSWKNYNEYVIMEDHSTPYQIKKLEHLKFTDAPNGIEWEVDSFVVPLYKHIFMTAEDAYDVIINLIKETSDSIKNVIEDTSQVVIRLFLAPSVTYKNFRINNTDCLNEKIFFSQVNYPKYLWICEYSTIDSYSRHMSKGEYILDATSSKQKMTETIISMRHGNTITYRSPRNDKSHAFINLNISLNNEYKMFEDNNLKLI